VNGFIKFMPASGRYKDLNRGGFFFYMKDPTGNPNIQFGLHDFVKVIKKPVTEKIMLYPSYKMPHRVIACFLGATKVFSGLILV
jgi:hypothetical protein